MVKHQVFFSFHYDNDVWRAGKVRNMGIVDNSSTFCDNDWEAVRRNSTSVIEKWIDEQLQKRSCIVVLIGSKTSERKWVKYEIQRAYELKKGIVGIFVHKIKDRDECQCIKGVNPFDLIKSKNGLPLSNYITAYNSPFNDSKDVYNDISNKIDKLISDAISKRGTY